MARSLNQQVAIRTRQAKAVELRREGNTYADIAAQLGYSDASAARKAVHRAIQEIGQDEARALVALQYERLNEMLAQTWPMATDATHPKCLQAITSTMKIMDRMQDLLLPVGSGGRHQQDRSSDGSGQNAGQATTVIAIQPRSDKTGT